jgi:hypothetical protein
MYEQWRLRRWDTTLSDAKNLFMDSLHDHAGGLEMEFGDYFNNVATARYRVTFRKYAAYRNIDESYRLELWNRRQQLNDPTATGWTFVVPESPWVQEFVNEPILELFNPGIAKHVNAPLLCGEAVGFFSALPGVFLLEAIHASGGIDQLLFTGEERMAARADFNSDVAFVG